MRVSLLEAVQCPSGWTIKIGHFLSFHYTLFPGNRPAIRMIWFLWLCISVACCFLRFSLFLNCSGNCLIFSCRSEISFGISLPKVFISFLSARAFLLVSWEVFVFRSCAGWLASILLYYFFISIPAVWFPWTQRLFAKKKHINTPTIFMLSFFFWTANCGILVSSF